MKNETTNYMSVKGKENKKEAFSLTCNELFDIVYLRENNPLYFSLHSVSPSIQKKIKSMIKNHVYDFFDKKDAYKITIEDVSSFYNMLSKKSIVAPGKISKILSVKYQQDIITYTKVAFSILNDLNPSVIYRNPFESKFISAIKLDKAKNRTPAFEINDIRNLFASNWDDLLSQAFALVCAYTGLRMNECACLKKADFIFYDNYVELNINKNWSPSLYCIKDTKTSSGVRHVVIPIKLFNYIKPVLFWNNDSFVFSLDGKRPIYYRTYSSYLNKAMEKNNVSEWKERGLVFYSFRPWYKSYTSSFMSSELSDYVMGHSSNRMGNRYFHYQSEIHAKILLVAVNDFPVNLNGTILD